MHRLQGRRDQNPMAEATRNRCRVNVLVLARPHAWGARRAPPDNEQKVEGAREATPQAIANAGKTSLVANASGTIAYLLHPGPLEWMSFALAWISKRRDLPNGRAT